MTTCCSKYSRNHSIWKKNSFELKSMTFKKTTIF
jgi:hypothetical protein